MCPVRNLTDSILLFVSASYVLGNESENKTSIFQLLFRIAVKL